MGISSPNSNAHQKPCRFLRHGSKVPSGKRHQLRLQLEQLESRHLLAADVGLAPEPMAQSIVPPAPITWFESFDHVQRIAFESLGEVDPVYDDAFQGPRELAVGEWIVQLTDRAASKVRVLQTADEILDDAPNDFTVIAGLGSEGLILMRGTGVSAADIQSSLHRNGAVESFSLNSVITGQTTTPNESDFAAGLLDGLNTIGAPVAWDESTGSLQTVVGVIDSGVDLDHPDLYLNLWLNQGEIPASFKNDLEDIDGDGLITFYDLNNLHVIDGDIYVASTVVLDGTGNLVSGELASVDQLTTATPYAVGVNATYVTDLAGQRDSVNGRIDALDLLADPRWSDGRDTDANGFFDDLFGVNFRSGADDDFAANEPDDALGHGTHVAGTIGAVGNNHTGVVGVNWQASLMSLRILDNSNRSDAGAALRAVNYAKSMRERHSIDDNNRTVEGANLRVLNNSWGQPGGYELAFETAIGELGDAGVLFVAAAGNGDIFGNGVDNDQTPFYPASYEVDNVIAVAAATPDDRLATFSNYGRTSVDIAAIGTGIRSTLKGGGYGTANGTSMAAPHVAGTAALVWSAFPQATVNEIREALLSEQAVESLTGGTELVRTGGRLSAANAIRANVFAPSAKVIAKEKITTTGGTATEFTIQYSHRDGINLDSIDDDDVIVTRQWGPADEIAVTLKPGSKAATAEGAVATYVMEAPGGATPRWDALDYGEYVIATVAGHVEAGTGDGTTQTRDVGSFIVKIEDDPSIIYVDSFTDSLAPGSLRSAIVVANAAAPSERTILLNSGTYTIDLAPVIDPTSAFGSEIESLEIFDPGGWSDASSGDFDVQGNVNIFGDTNDRTLIDAQGFDRVFKVHPTASLGLSRLSVIGGVAPARQGGGGILSVGDLNLHQVIVRENVAVGEEGSPQRYGGGLAIWGGTATLNETWLTENRSDYGGGIFYSGNATGVVGRSTIDHNLGGGLYSLSSQDLSVSNSTFSTNSGGWGTIANGLINYSANSGSPTISADGRYVAFNTEASNLVPEDSNNTSDVLVFDQSTGKTERVSVSGMGVEANGYSSHPSLSGDGRYVTFHSIASNLVPDDTNGASDIFIYDRIAKSIDRLSVSNSGVEGNGVSAFGSISNDGRYVAFTSGASNLVPGDTNSQFDVFVYDRSTTTIERVSVSDVGAEGNDKSLNPSISGDGRYVAFYSDASNLVPGDTNNQFDIFVYDRSTATIERVSVSDVGMEGNGGSFNPSISGDGRYVAFHSSASNLVPGDTGNRSDVFVYDRATDSIERVSVGDTGVEGNRPSSHASLSADGRYLTFFSSASNLVAGDTNGTADTFVYDRSTEAMERVSLSNEGTEGNDHSSFSFGSLLSGDGRYATFISGASNLVPGDSDIVNQDIFVYDRSTDTIDSVTYRKSSSNVDVNHSTIAFASESQAFVTISGEVTVRESLFAANEVFSDLDSRAASASGQNILFTTPQSDFIGPLQRQGYLPPVHPLLVGNPAIDSADPAADGTLDQLGQIRIQPDYGAVEAATATVTGKVYFDRNQDGQLDIGEPGIEGIQVTVTGGVGFTTTSGSDNLKTSVIDESGTLNLIGLAPGETQFDAHPTEGWSVYTPPLTLVRSESNLADGPSSNTSLSGDGRYLAFHSQAGNLVAMDTNSEGDVFVYDRLLGAIDRVSVSNTGVAGNGPSNLPSISTEGRYVTFQSNANNLVPGDTNGVSDIFVYDRSTDLIERISISDGGVEGNAKSDAPSISADGRYVSFHSYADNLVSEDNNNAFDVFVYDRFTDTIERVSTNQAGEEGSSSSFAPAMSGDGRIVAFESIANNLVAGDTNGLKDIFVYDRSADTVERVSINGAGESGNANSFSPSLSGDGRFVTFVSDANNLVADDTNDASDVFVFDRSTGEIQRISIGRTGVEGNAYSDSPALSVDGRYVTFRSFSSNLVPDDKNGSTDIFVYDRSTGSIERVSVSDAGGEGNHHSNFPSLSPDGRSVAFASQAENWVPGADNHLSDIFIAFNPLASPSVTRDLQAGEFFTELNIGLIPDPGTITGRVFEDVVGNGVYDAGEPVDVTTTVFLDLNFNRQLDDGERFAIPDAEGRYEFTNIDAHLSYTIAAIPPNGHEQVAPGASGDFVWDLFLPAGGTITNRDFGFRRVQASGQSTASAVSGRVFEDNNDNGIYDEGVDLPHRNIPIYLDGNGDRKHTAGADEPITTTAADGSFWLGDLGSRIASVRTSLGGDFVHQSPFGNAFENQTSNLFTGVNAFTTLSDASHADFDQDGFEDLAVLISDGNVLAIRLNDQNGAFAPSDLNLPLGQTPTMPGTSFPLEMVVGQFNGDAAGKSDVAIVGQASGNVLILLDFDEDRKDFLARQSIPVGLNPISLTSGDFDNNGSTDLAVLNFGTYSLVQSSPPVFAKTDETFQLLLNDGAGNFAVQPAIPLPGEDPVSIVAANFNNDANGHVDLAVLHKSPTLPDTPFGDVALFTGNGAGGFALSHIEPVGGGPLEMVRGDFNGDGIPDLAVANVSQNTLSILAGRSDGALIRERAYSIGTGDRGVDSMDVADIDNDGDLDIVATRLSDGGVAVFRNITDTTANPVHVRFEPLESFGVAQASIFERAPLVLANFDNDTSGPNGDGTIDIATIPKSTTTINVLRNRLVDGGHRVPLDGLNAITELDFIITPVLVPPTLNPIPDPPLLIEGDGAVEVSLGGISKGRVDGPDLQLTATSSHPLLIPHPVVNYVAGATQALLTFTPNSDANTSEGPITIIVEARNAGANETFNDSDDGIIARTFTVTIRSVNDPPTFDIPSLISVSQKAGAQSTDAFAGNISPGGGSDEATQRITDFSVATQQSNLFSTAPVIDRQGRLTYTPDPNRAGIAIVNVSLSDDGGRDFAGMDTTTKVFAIHVTPVNDPPSVNLRGDLAVAAGAGPQTEPAFATGFNPGTGDDDASQVISDFIVSVDHPDWFASIPEIDHEGTLTFTPLVSASGTATVTVRVRDNGGRRDGGDDLSAPQTFNITFLSGPNVESVVINDGDSTSHSQVTSLTVVFGEEVNHTTLDGAFKLTNLDSDIEVGSITVAASNSGGKTTVVLAFSGASTVARMGGNSLADGNYRLEIAASQVTTPDGSLAMASDFQFGGQAANPSNNDGFFRLFGDTDGDGDVDGQDYGRFGLTFLKREGQSGYDPDMDFDGDGDVDGQDYGQFGGRFLRRLAI
ncbi:S8 family serine peptidase [Stieleria sp. ICT_E10.1]|uniref:S8 family serine peptidase n=1 Tax=Stieleria sedimenti TaxID=2976331 RepID=UPI00218017F1|nr:S8 family serine peptidase [Stieleria sedimenti]MCS7465424.1 S8 family serine peptidase [Stieleria sedimenti]